LIEAPQTTFSLNAVRNVLRDSREAIHGSSAWGQRQAEAGVTSVAYPDDDLSEQASAGKQGAYHSREEANPRTTSGEAG
jgi:hypothetical protein